MYLLRFLGFAAPSLYAILSELLWPTFRTKTH